jgi:hypothetical protein
MPLKLQHHVSSLHWMWDIELASDQCGLTVGKSWSHLAKDPMRLLKTTVSQLSTFLQCGTFCKILSTIGHVLVDKRRKDDFAEVSCLQFWTFVALGTLCDIEYLFQHFGFVNLRVITTYHSGLD